MVVIDADAELIELLQTLIRNSCVSTSAPDPHGDEIRNVEALRSVLDGPGLEVEIVRPENARPSLIARIEGTDAGAPSLGLLSHTDVVPAASSGWMHDPFGGELIDGEVWGRGAVDMLNQTAAMALAVRRLADRGFRPRGTLTLAAVPDEECGGRFGMKPLVEQFPELVCTDFVLTEVGGATQKRLARGPLIEAYVAEKGMMNLTISVRGTPGHTSRPWGSDNALIKAAVVVRRLAEYRPPTHIADEWKVWVAAQDLDRTTKARLVDPDGLWDALPSLPADLACQAHASNHCAIVPAIIEGGEKLGTIPELVTVRVSLRPAIDDDPDAILASIQGLLADVVQPSDILLTSRTDASRSMTSTALWPVLEEVASTYHPGATLVPSLLPAQTDARWLRPRGVTVYGFGVLSARVTPGEYWSRFHGRNERIDTESLGFSLRAWLQICQEFLAGRTSQMVQC